MRVEPGSQWEAALLDKHQDGSHLVVEEITSTRGCCGGDEAGGRAKSVKTDDTTGVKRR
jgi:hypothetical protein